MGFVDNLDFYSSEDFYLGMFDVKFTLFFGFKEDVPFIYFDYKIPKESRNRFAKEQEYYWICDRLSNPPSPKLTLDVKRVVYGIISSLFEYSDREVYTNYIYHGSSLHMSKGMDEKQYKKIKSYFYIRSKKITDVIVSRIYAIYKIYYNVTEKDIDLMKKATYRLGDKNNLNICYNLLRVKNSFSKKEYDRFISDMIKLPQGFCLYVFRMIGKFDDCNFDFNQYLDIVKNAPKFIKKCKYCISFKELTLRNLEKLGVEPKARIQYFLSNLIDSYFFIDNNNDVEINQDDDTTIIFKKLISGLELKHWHYFKNYLHYKGPYNNREIVHMITFIQDGMRIYNTNHDNEYGIKLEQVKGSVMKMLQKAVYNHHQLQKIQRANLLKEANSPTVLPPVELPEWIENIRLKTKHDMIIAGQECHHCIGNYKNSNDTFVREGDVCAQIRRHDLTVGQCYDKHDSITEESEDLKKRLNKALAPLRSYKNE